MAAPLDSDMHSELRAEMCDSRLLGDDGAARYFVGVLTNNDFFKQRDNSFLHAAKTLTEQLIGDAAKSFRFSDESVVWLCPLFELAFRERFPTIQFDRKWGKCDQAVVCLLKNPGFTDATIAEAVPTTLDQLARFSSYQYVKRRFLIP